MSGRRLYLGCAVWGEQGWEGSFFPTNCNRKEYLFLYGERLYCVEGNTVFYGIPSQETLVQWRNMTHEHFRFCLKFPRAISHQGALADQCVASIDFAKHIEQSLSGRLGPFFLQLPPTYSVVNGPDLSQFLNHWRREYNGAIAVEVRHPSWFIPANQERLNIMLHRLGHGRVIMDTRPIYEGSDDAQDGCVNKKPKLPIHESCTNAHIFVRLICHPNASENEVYFAYWAPRIVAWLGEEKEVYFFIHCPQERYSVYLLRRFQEVLEEHSAQIPSLPWNDLPKWGLFD
jgi:uncharacterized protein YecE (DUF72 family)